MAKYLSTTFGKISGKHGTAVAAVVNGESVLKIFTPPSDRKTTGQLAQRSKFALVFSALNPLRNIITVGFGKSGDIIRPLRWLYVMLFRAHILILVLIMLRLCYRPAHCRKVLQLVFPLPVI